MISRLRWHLHELDPAWEPKAAASTLNVPSIRSEAASGIIRGGGQVAVELTERCAESHHHQGAGEMRSPTRSPRGRQMAPALLGTG